jgi:hypothetical protein
MSNSDIVKLTDAFKLTCKKCGSDDVVLDAEDGVDYGGETGYSPGQITAGCNNCKQNDVVVWI